MSDPPSPASPPPPASPPSPASRRPIDRPSLATRAGVSDEALEQLVALGIVRRHEDGSFREQDVTTVRLAVALGSSGISLDDLGAALASGELPDFGKILAARPIGLAPRSYRQVAAKLGLDPDAVPSMMEALGLPDIELDDRIREDDADLLEVAAAALGAGLPPETFLQSLRIFAEHLDRIAEHQRTLFRRDIQDRMLASGIPRAEMLAASAAVREVLIELSFRASHLIHRRMLERHAFENTTEQIEILLDEAGVRRRPDHDPPAMVFVDLSGYTRMTEEEGDERAAERGAQLAQIVRGAAGRHNGRLIKLLGDGAMVHFTRAEDAVAAAHEIVDLVDESPLPAAHVGIAAGPMIRRDGDYFGATVNLASRICDAATAGAVLATRRVADLTPGRGWIDVGEVTLAGVPEPVALVELARPD